MPRRAEVSTKQISTQAAPGGARDLSIARKRGRPPASDGDVTRRRILDAAEVCFARFGYRATSNKLVAEMAEITTGTIYHYFASKQEMFLAAHEEIQRELISLIETVLSSKDSFGDALDYMLELLMIIFFDNPTWGLFISVVRAEAKRNPEISAALDDRAWRTLYTRLAQMGVASGAIAADDETAFRAILSATVLGLTQHNIEASAATHRECVRGFRLLLRGMLVRPGG